MTRSTSRLVGDIEVVALCDAAGLFPDAVSVAFPDADHDVLASAARLDPASFGPDDGWWLHFRCFAIRLPTGAVGLVDCGVGPGAEPSWTPAPGVLPDALAAAGIGVDDVQWVVLTHLHSDHIGWAVRDAKPVFGAATYYVQRLETVSVAPVVADTVLTPLDAAQQLARIDGDMTVASGVALFATPGHTPGHQSVVINSGGSEVLIAGDVIVHPVQVVDPGQRYVHEYDATVARETRLALLRRAAHASAGIATAHLGTDFLDL